MTVKEHESPKRSLSLCSISERVSGSQKKAASQAEEPPLEMNSPCDIQRMKNIEVVLTPMGICNANSNGGRNMDHHLYHNEARI